MHQEVILQWLQFMTMMFVGLHGINANSLLALITGSIPNIPPLLNQGDMHPSIQDGKCKENDH